MVRYRITLVLFLFGFLSSISSLDFSSVLDAALSIDKEYKILNLQKENSLLDLEPEGLNISLQGESYDDYDNSLIFISRDADTAGYSISISPVLGISMGGSLGTSFSISMPYSIDTIDDSFSFSPGIVVEQPLIGYPYSSRSEYVTLEYQLLSVKQDIIKRRAELALEILDIVQDIIEIKKELLAVDSEIDSLENDINLIKKSTTNKNSLEFRKKDYELRKQVNTKKNLISSLKIKRSMYKSLTGTDEIPEIDESEFDIPEDSKLSFSYILASKYTEKTEADYQDAVNPIPEISLLGGCKIVFSNSGYEEGIVESGANLYLGSSTASISLNYNISSSSLSMAIGLGINIDTTNKDVRERQNSLEEARLKEELEIYSAENNIKDCKLLYQQYKEDIEFARENLILSKEEYQLVNAAFEKGAASELDVKNSQREIDEANYDLVIAKINMLSLFYQIKRDFLLEEF
ncbi:TolC family protein [Spirochaetia bacterium 38H-sp]|uniref:TolC family protein n=1 Tax=Rarispira pelagica TaxID=3141764 RepID=A0ABU9UEG5_9SPIR